MRCIEVYSSRMNFYFLWIIRNIYSLGCIRLTEQCKHSNAARENRVLHLLTHSHSSWRHPTSLCSWKESVACVCFLFAACHVPVLVDMQRSANTAYTRSVDLWPVLSPLHAHLAFYLKTSLSRWALARVSIVCLLPWSRSVVLLLFFSLAWMSLIQPDSYITFPVPSDIPSSHISMSKHTHLPLPLSWIDSGLCPPTFPPFSPSPSRVSPRPLSAY